MKINREQKDLLISVLEKTLKKLDIADSMEFGTDLRHLLNETNKLKTEE